MEIRIKTSDYQMPPETAAYLDEKIGAIAKLVGDDPSALCDVEVGRAVGHSQQGNVWMAELTLVIAGDRLRAIAHEESVNAAIDVAKDEMVQQLRKSKGKHTAESRKIGARIKEWMRFEN